MQPGLNALIIILAAFLLAGHLYFEKKGQQKGRLSTKTVLSLLFVFAAAVQSHPIPVYYYMMLTGLIFCLGGDVFLALPQERMFLCGLVSFLVGHVFYVFGFWGLTQINQWTWIGGFITLVISTGVFFWLRTYLGTMLIPVIVYIVVITTMLVGAWTVLGDGRINFAGRLLVFVGAASFYLSDLFVARDRFLKPGFGNRLIGLPMYYLGQFLLAFSVGLMK